MVAAGTLDVALQFRDTDAERRRVDLRELGQRTVVVIGVEHQAGEPQPRHRDELGEGRVLDDPFEMPLRVAGIVRLHRRAGGEQRGERGIRGVREFADERFRQRPRLRVVPCRRVVDDLLVAHGRELGLGALPRLPGRPADHRRQPDGEPGEQALAVLGPPFLQIFDLFLVGRHRDFLRIRPFTRRLRSG